MKTILSYSLILMSIPSFAQEKMTQTSQKERPEVVVKKEAQPITSKPITREQRDSMAVARKEMNRK